MADTKISGLTAITSGHASGDLLELVDISDTTMAASGTNKKTTIAALFANIPGATNAATIASSGHSLTGANAQSMVDYSATWNTSGTPTLLKYNLVDTASNAASIFMDLQVGGVSVWKVTKAGAVTAAQSFSTPGSFFATSYFNTSASGMYYAGNFRVAFGSATNGVGEMCDGTLGNYRDFKVRKHFVDQTITAGGTTGDRTIDKAAGTVNIAAAGTTVTVTSSQCTTSSTVHAVIRTNDTTAVIKNVVPGAGSFVITLNAAATAEVSIGWLIIN